MKPFHQALLDVFTDVQSLIDVSICYKDALAVHRTSVPASVGQHRWAYCRAAKSLADGERRCRSHDDGQSDVARHRHPFLRRCPFGVVEVVVPLHLAGRYQGCVLIGCWRKGRCRVCELIPTYRDLPRLEPDRAMAVGRLVQSAVSARLTLREDAPGPSGAMDERMQAALGYIQLQFHAGLRAREVADEVCLSLSRFVHLFNQTLGEGFGDYVRRLVMRRAGQLLCDTELSIGDCARELGYTNANHFATVFKRHYQCSPIAFRRRVRSVSA